MFIQTRYKIIRIILTGLLIIFFTGVAQAAKKKKDPEDSPALMTQVELQSQVMAFADRFTSIISSAVDKYHLQAPAPENYRSVLSIAAYSLSSAFTIAAEANPVGALLDMISMVTLGRIIFEENLQKKFGPQLKPVIEGYPFDSVIFQPCEVVRIRMKKKPGACSSQWKTPPSRWKRRAYWLSAECTWQHGCPC